MGAGRLSRTPVSLRKVSFSGSRASLHDETPAGAVSCRLTQTLRIRFLVEVAVGARVSWLLLVGGAWLAGRRCLVLGHGKSLVGLGSGVLAVVWFAFTTAIATGLDRGFVPAAQLIRTHTRSKLNNFPRPRAHVCMGVRAREGRTRRRDG